MQHRSAVVALGLVVLAACGDDRPTVPEAAVQIPDAYRHTSDALAAVGPSAMSQIFVYDGDFADASPGGGFDEPHLFVGAAHLTDGGYVADELVVGRLLSGGWFEGRWVVEARCTGTATYADQTWTLALAGSPACEHWNGVFRPRPVWADSWDDPRLEPSEPPPAVLTLVAPPPTTAFARALAGIESIEPSALPCPIALHVPAVEITEGASPGAAALHHTTEREGEGFEVIDATSGEMLPSAPESSGRYQALFVRVEHAAPEVLDDTTFVAGHARGRAYLVDTTEGRIVCAGDVEATNGASITGRDAASARMWLTLQLMVAEERAIALGMRAIAPPPE